MKINFLYHRYKNCASIQPLIVGRIIRKTQYTLWRKRRNFRVKPTSMYRSQ